MDEDRYAGEAPPRPEDDDETTGTAHIEEDTPQQERGQTVDPPIALGAAADAETAPAKHPTATGDAPSQAAHPPRLVTPPADDGTIDESSDVEANGSQADATMIADEPAAQDADATGGPSLSTTCPVCGQTTPANRFCGFCGAPLTEAHRRTASETGDPFLRVAGRVHDWVFPGSQPIDVFWHRIVVGIALLIALIALLANDIGIALLATTAITPVLLILTLSQLDVFERESPLLSAGAALAGVIGGLIIGGIMSWAAREWWFSTGGVNHGAAGYGADYAKAAGQAPFLLILGNGILLPAIGVAAALLGPIALRRFGQFRNEAMDGLVLGALGGAGYVFGAAIVFVLPVIGDGGPDLSVRHWTLLVVGLALLRPLVVTAGAAVFAAGLWRSMMTERSSALVIPAIAGAGGIVLLYLGTMFLEPRSLALEVGWNLLLTIVLAAALGWELRQAIAFDRRVIGANRTRVTCPSCGQVTPRGAYCAHCGQPLPATDAA